MNEVTPCCQGPSQEPYRRRSAHAAMSVGMRKLSATAATKIRRTEGLRGCATTCNNLLFLSSSVIQLKKLLNGLCVSCTRSQYQFSLCQSSQQTHENEGIRSVEDLEMRWDLGKTGKCLGFEKESGR